MTSGERFIVYPVLLALAAVVLFRLGERADPLTTSGSDTLRVLTATRFVLVDSRGREIGEWKYDEARDEVRFGGSNTRLSAQGLALLHGERRVARLGVAGKEGEPHLVFYGRSSTDQYTTLIGPARIDLQLPLLPLSGISMSVESGRLPEDPAARLRVRGELLVTKASQPLGDGVILTPSGRILLREGPDMRMINARGD